MRPDLANKSGTTPLLEAFENYFLDRQTPEGRGAGFDTLRFLFESPHIVDDFGTGKWAHSQRAYVQHLWIAASPQVAGWLWDHATNNYSGSELLTLQIMIFKDVLFTFDYPWEDERVDATLKILIPKFTMANCRLLDEISLGNIGALKLLYKSYQDERLSQDKGQKYIALLTSLGIDFESSILTELEKLPGGIIGDYYPTEWKQKALFYQDEEQNWVLRWEWKLDEGAPMYDLFSEFPRMTTHKYHALGWPFCTPNWSRIDFDFDAFLETLPEPVTCGLDDSDTELDSDAFFGSSPESEGFRTAFDQQEDDSFWPPHGEYTLPDPQWEWRDEPVLQARLARRIDKKSRKDFARSGHKRPRSRMPGSWV